MRCGERFPAGRSFATTRAPRCCIARCISTRLARTGPTTSPQAGIIIPPRPVLGRGGIRPALLRATRMHTPIVAYAQASAPTTLVRFRTRRKLGPFEFFKITGSLGCLGDWDRSKAPRMVPYGDDVWELDVMVPVGALMNFTCVVIGDGGEDGEQVTRTLVVNDCERLDVDFDFGQEKSMRVTVVGSRNGEDGAKRASSGLAGNWQGKEIQFMTSNEHPRQRDSNWQVDNLEGLAKQIVLGDMKAGSWLQKLEVATRWLVEQAYDKRPDVDAVAFCHVYLSWINQGLIPCVEAGGHRRPNHHAKASLQLFRSLEWVIEPGRQEKELVWIARRLQMKLPSFSSEYRRSEPLTRIRDIAHRNDIPKDMKHQIKHTIQNKLHRNAGPEDLVASELLYERILQDQDNLSPDFVHEFGVFVAELRDFFNAGSLTQLLRKIGPTLVFDDDADHSVDRFLSLQKELDSVSFDTLGPAAQQNKIIEALHAVTTVRALICSRLQSGLRNDAPEAALSMRQSYRIAEVKTEEYAFVLLSRFINVVESSGGFDHLDTADDQSWSLSIGAVVLGIRQIGLDGWEALECAALENELSAWLKEGNLTKPVNALRLKASLERLQRMSEGFCDSVLDVLSPRARDLGLGLGISDYQAQVFAESEIRASVVFQVSKLNALLLKACRKASGQSPWDMLVPGISYGKLIFVDSLDSASLPRDAEGNAVLVVKSADGDEDVAHLVAGTGSKMNVTGIILCQELPHLSHLGVRARQEKLVFAACWDPDVLDGEVRYLDGEDVRLEVGASGVVLERGTGEFDNGVGRGPGNAKTGFRNEVTPPGNLVYSGKPVIPQLEAQAEICGAKAGNCGFLEDIAVRSGTFSVPRGACLPFENMEKHLTGGIRASIKMAFRKIEWLLSQGNSGEELDAAISEISDIVQPPRPQVLEFLRTYFEPGSRVIVRSSSNMEDMAGMSGAGLHDSISNVDPTNSHELGRAIAAVWASLHTKRAIQSRTAAGLAHEDARMGVLIQQQLFPDVSFVLHTTDPISKDADFLQAEIAPGIGETLASGARGTPWRLRVNKRTAEVESQAFANFSHILMPEGVQSRGKRVWKPTGENSGLVYKVADYAVQPLSIEEDKRDLIGRRLVEVGALLEQQFGGKPQDVEGAVVGNDLFIVQSRPQPM